MPDFYIKKGDTAPPLRVFLRQRDNTAIPLPSGTVVKFHMNDGAIADGAVTILDAVLGKVEYVWQSGDTATAGTFDSEFEITYVGGSIQTVPSKGYIEIQVSDDQRA